MNMTKDKMSRPQRAASVPKLLPKSVTETPQANSRQGDAADKSAPQGGAPAGAEVSGGVWASDTDYTMWKLAGREVDIQDSDANLLVEYFRATGELTDGQSLTDLPEGVQEAVASRTEAALAAARKWAGKN